MPLAVALPSLGGGPPSHHCLMPPPLNLGDAPGAGCHSPGCLEVWGCQHLASAGGRRQAASSPATHPRGLSVSSVLQRDREPHLQGTELWGVGGAGVCARPLPYHWHLASLGPLLGPAKGCPKALPGSPPQGPSCPAWLDLKQVPRPCCVFLLAMVCLPQAAVVSGGQQVSRLPCCGSQLGHSLAVGISQRYSP